MFIRTKKVKDKYYAYLVENTWQDNTSKQEVKKYLGRVFEIPTPPKLFADQHYTPNQIISELIMHEAQPVIDDPGVEINLENNTVTYRSRDVVISTNGGYICKYTLTELFAACKSPDGDRPGKRLAQALSDAGLRLRPQAFIALYTHLTS